MRRLTAVHNPHPLNSRNTSAVQYTAVQPRLIRLRRPVTLSVLDGPFVPNGQDGLLDKIERRWNALLRANPAFFDGRLLHVLGVHRNGYGGAVLHVVDCAYRFHAVQDESFDLGVRPLGVKGVTDHNGRILLGRRSSRVAACRGMWEFAPGGVVEPGDQPDETVRRELTEETALRCAGEPVAAAVIFDPVVRSWEVVFRLSIHDTAALSCSTAEYDELRWCTTVELPPTHELSPIARQMLPLITAQAKP